MRSIHVLLLLLAGVASVPGPARAQIADGPTLAAVKAKGFVDCGAGLGTPGFGYTDSKGIYRGLDADSCRAIAAAVFGDPAKVRFTPLNSAQRLPALQTGQVDVLIQTLTWSHSREAAAGLEFAAVNYYDGQGFLVRRSAGLTKAAELDGASICTTAGSTSELNVADWARHAGVTYRAVVFERNDESRGAYEKGRCDAYSTDASQLAALRSTFPTPDDHIILPDIISKEPLGIAVRKGDDQWLDIVKWTSYALIEAEEQGITQANVDGFLTSQVPVVRRMLGVTGDHGKLMGLDNRWAYWAIKAVGNYGEVFERNLGEGSPLKLARGRNALWSKGGLMYAPPIR
ncbi:amino acid ABC transporter substrate-binding protein [Limobrevibacterium gyesilva]|uniref:Amino acid ABC transporter substrate-binding protein n=1 Tax=Limobrevibacterium gyesilva TaxID=2991712 RepID=A0AA41YIH7_9PROT|nr:amino acid ABC transporter substrate-binding protein [Limobrevibacterium gyesilva]MCW3473664.1 amino acid ABC transporter substrate-binding protein [Limobrevibacterium gyesilva]